MKKTKNIYDIIWETDGHDTDLPKQVAIPKDIDDDDIADYLSDNYDWLVNSFKIEGEKLI